MPAFETDRLLSTQTWRNAAVTNLTWNSLSLCSYCCHKKHYHQIMDVLNMHMTLQCWNYPNTHMNHMNQKVYPSTHESKTSPCHLGCGSLTTHAHANTRTHTHARTRTPHSFFLAKRSEGHGSKNAVSVEQRNLTRKGQRRWSQQQLDLVSESHRVQSSKASNQNITSVDQR